MFVLIFFSRIAYRFYIPPGIFVVYGLDELFFLFTLLEENPLPVPNRWVYPIPSVGYLAALDTYQKQLAKASRVVPSGCCIVSGILNNGAACMLTDVKANDKTSIAAVKNEIINHLFLFISASPP